MSSESGHAPQADARTAIALLAIAGLTLGAAVLPAVGSSAPGSSLVPDALGNATNPDDPDRDAATTTEDTGGDALVDGLLGQLPRNDATVQRDGSGNTGNASDPGVLGLDRTTTVGSAERGVRGSLRNDSAAPHAVVRSPEPDYWRTGAYDTYTGTGWEMTPEAAAAAAAAAPDATAGADRRTVTQEYRLLRPATSLPATWRPTAVESTDGDVRVTDRGRVRAPEGLPANATYTVESTVPPQDVTRLRDAGTDYPDAVATHYTTVPAETPERVTTRTDRIAGDVESPYETAVAVESWLRANKRYAPDASHGDGDVVDQFLFEADRGNAAHFASAMAVMLRTQGVPARYAVGYSTGQPYGGDTYLVRELNTHAWVEVYVPESGWVRFDPTPGDERLRSEYESYRRALETGEATADPLRDSESGELPTGAGPNSSEPALSERASHDATATPGTDGDTETGPLDSAADGTGAAERSDAVRDAAAAYNHTEDGSPGSSADASGEGAYRVSLTSDPVPGQPLTVRVSNETGPVSGSAVQFDGDPVGRTDESGAVTGTVPFTDALVVNVTTPAAGTVGNPSVSQPGPTDGQRVGTATAGVEADALPANISTDPVTTRTFTVPTEITVTADGSLAPGERVTVRATVADQPVSDAAVTVDGASVGRTDERGERPVTLPANETTTVRVRRGDAAGATDLRLADVAVNTSGFALPGLTVTATVTDGGDPVEGATLTAGDTRVETGPGGASTIRLPVGTGATLVAETPAGVQETERVDYRFLTAGAGLGLGLAVLVLAGFLTRTVVAGDRSLRDRLAAAIRRLSRGAVGALVAAAVAAERLGASVSTALRLAGQAAADTLRALADAIRAREFGAPPGPRTLVSRLRDWLAGLVGRIRSVSAADRQVDGETSTTTTGGRTADATDARARIERAWREFRSQAPVSDHRSKTPGELARRAIEDGLPASAVRTLRDAVRDVEYGRRDPEAHVDEVVAAQREIREATDTGRSQDTVADGGVDRDP